MSDRPAAARAAHRHAARRPAARRRRASGWAAAWSRTSSSRCSSGSGTARSRPPDAVDAVLAGAAGDGEQPAAGAQRDRRPGAHQPRPGAAVARGGRGGRRGERHHRRRARPRAPGGAARAARARSPRCSPPSPPPRPRSSSTTAPRPSRSSRPRSARAASWCSPAASWSRSATASASPSCSRPPAPACARSGRRTGSPSTTTATRWHRETGAVLKVHPSNFVVRGFTRAVERGRAGRRAGRHRRPAGRRRRLGPAAPAPAAARRARPAEHARRRRRPRAGQRRQAARRPAGRAGPRAGPSWSSGCAGTRSTARCGSTRRRWPPWRRRCAGRCRRCRRCSPPTSTACGTRARALAGRLAAAGLDAVAVDAEARVGGGGAPEHPLPSAAVSLPPSLRRSAAARLAAGRRLRRRRPHAAEPAQPAARRTTTPWPPPCWRWPADGRDRHRGSRRSRQVRARPGAHRHGARPLGRGAPARAHHRPRLRLDDAAVGTPARGRRRARPRALRRQHARRGRFGARRAGRGRGGRRLVGPDRRARRRPRRARRAARPARGDQGRSRRPRRPCWPTRASGWPRRPWARCPASRSARAPGPGCPSWSAALERLLAGLPAPDRDRAGPALDRPRVHHPRRRHGGHRHARRRRRWRPGDRLRLGDRDVVVRGRAVPRRAGRAGGGDRPGGAQPARDRGRGALPRRRPADPGRLPHHRRRRRDADGAARTSGCPAEPVVHVGSATVGARLRPLDGAVVRLRLATPCRCASGDRLLLRDPGQPPGARRRRAGRRPARAAPARGGAAAGGRAGRAGRPARPGAAGRAGPPADRADGRLRRDGLAGAAGRDGARAVAARRRAWSTSSPPGCRRSSPATGSCGRWSPGRRSRCCAGRWTLPDADLLPAVVRPPFALRDGRVVDDAAALPAAGAARRRRRPGPAGRRPVRRPRGAGAGGRRARAPASWRPPCAAASWSGSPRASTSRRAWPSEARARLAALPQPFTLSQARQAWGTSRRVAVPLMEWLDARGVTERLPDNTRRLR